MEKVLQLKLYISHIASVLFNKAKAIVIVDQK